MGLISTGTGCGLARSLGIPQGDLKAQFEIALSRSFRDVDLGRIVAGDGRMWFFVSECQIGIGAEVVRHTQSARKAFGGVLAYAIATVPLLFTYPNPRMELECDDLSSRSLRITGISIGNCSITGGGMRLTPHAVPDDGALDVLVIKGQSPFQRLRAFLKVRSGRHIESPAFEYFRVRSLRMKSPDRVGLAADGELLGQPSVYIDVIPQALRVHCPGYHQEEESHEHTRSEIAEIGV
jgi:diacylglycerol kinase (ATP)